MISMDEQFEIYQAILDEGVERLKAMGFSPTAQLGMGAPGPEIALRANDLETSESEEFSLLGVGPRSHGYANQRREVGWSRWG
jgi:hypothetical protein